MIILPYCIYGHLGQLSLNSNQLRDAIRQILEALRHLHEQNYIHRDLKPTNILVRNGPEEHLDLAVADYALVSLENPRTFCGSKPYMAPEIWSNNDLEESERILYCKAVDIYALGILILRMLRIAVPKVNTTTRTIFMTHVKSLVSNEMDECDSGDTERRDALLMADRMLQYDPENRPSVDECLRFPWLYHFTAAPLALGLSRTPSNRPMVDSPSNPAVARRTKDWWSSTQCTTSSEQQGQKEKQTRDRRLNKRRKQPEQSQPSSSSDKYKIQKRRRNPLPTPRSTPKRDQKSEGSIVNSPNLRSGKSDEISQDGITLLSWDKMEMSDGAV